MAAIADHDQITYNTAHVLDWKRTLVGSLQDRGVACHSLGVADARDLRWTLRLRRLLLRGGYDIVHIHSPLVAAMARVVIRSLPAARRPRIVTTEHNIWSSYARATRLADRLTHRLDDMRLAVSPQVYQSLPARMREGTQVVIQGIVRDRFLADRQAREQIRDDLGVRSNETLAVTVANLRRQKGYGDLLEAAQRVKAEQVPVRFVAVGQGPLEEEIRARHASSGLGDLFSFLGYRDDVPRILAAGDLFVLASHYEGLPIALLEALAAGLPSVATSVGGVPVVVRNGVEGLVVPPRRPDLIAEAVMRIATDVKLCAELSAAASRRARAYDIRQTLQTTEEMYRGLVT